MEKLPMEENMKQPDDQGKESSKTAPFLDLTEDAPESDDLKCHNDAGSTEAAIKNKQIKFETKDQPQECLGGDGGVLTWFESGTCDSNVYMYVGPSEGSEPEIKAMTSYFQSISPQPEFFISLHSYGNAATFPYSERPDEVPRKGTLQKITRVLADALETAGQGEFSTGSLQGSLYGASGVSIDRAAKLGVKCPVLVELPEKEDKPANTNDGFNILPKYIAPIGKAMFDGLVNLLDKQWTTQEPRYGHPGSLAE